MATVLVLVVWRGLFILGQQRQKLLPTQCQTASGCGVEDRKPLWDDRRGSPETAAPPLAKHYTHQLDPGVNAGESATTAKGKHTNRCRLPCAGVTKDTSCNAAGRSR